MDFTAKNNFVVSNTDKKHFDKDLELFQKTFPNHKIIPSLIKANDFNKEKLDGRMLLEMLNHVSPEEILENRVVEKKDPTPPPVEMTVEEAKELLKEDITNLDYDTQLKPMAKALKIEAEDDNMLSLVKAFIEEISADDGNASGQGSEGDKEMTAEGAMKLLEGDITKLDYHQQMKPMVAVLGLDTKDLKKVTLVEALTVVKEGLENAHAEETKKTKPDETATGSDKVSAGDDKKKEENESSTQE